MLNFSTEFKTELSNDHRDYKLWVDITFPNGEVINLTNPDLWANTFSINDATSSVGKFTLGATVSARFKVTINNIYHDYDKYNFIGANVVPYIGMDLPSGVTEKVRLGIFVVEEANYNGSTISIGCLDNMNKFDRLYSDSTLVYPATLQEIVADACKVCGVIDNTGRFDNCDYVVDKQPEDANLTFREVISCVSQIAGCFAKINNSGELEIKWYDMEFLASSDLDGGEFDPTTPLYETGDDADGGNFKDYSSGDWYSGGTFLDMQNYHTISTFNSLTTSTDDVVLTGFKVTSQVVSGDNDTYTYGTDEYLIDISGNILIQKGCSQKVAEFLGQKLIGLRFRDFTATTLSDPSIEAGDVGYMTDRHQNMYKCFFSNRTFTVGNYEQLSCDAESPLKNSQERYSAIAKTLTLAENKTNTKVSEYDKQMEALTNTILNGLGLFKTTVVGEDGSVTYYMHNKRTLESSDIRWLMTANGLLVSNDYGKTWRAGIDASGNAVVNVLSAIGINADWVNVGTLRGVKLYGNEIEGATVKGTSFVGGSINIGNGKFVVNSDGTFSATSGTLSGTIKAGNNSTIGDFTIDNGHIKSALGIDISPSGISGNGWSINSYGTTFNNAVSCNSLSTGGINATGGISASGDISGSSINTSGTISGGSVNSSGGISGNSISAISTASLPTSTTVGGQDMYTYVGNIVADKIKATSIKVDSLEYTKIYKGSQAVSTVGAYVFTTYPTIEKSGTGYKLSGNITYLSILGFYER